MPLFDIDHEHRNMSKNTNNEWNEVNYIEELKKDQRFCLSTW